MKFKLLAVLMLAGSSLFAAPRVFVGIAPPVAGYVWVAPYRYPVLSGWGWHAGYWARPPYPRAYWVAPRYYGHHYYRGYWRR